MKFKDAKVVLQPGETINSKGSKISCLTDTVESAVCGTHTILENGKCVVDFAEEHTEKNNWKDTGTYSATTIMDFSDGNMKIPRKIDIASTCVIEDSGASFADQAAGVFLRKAQGHPSAPQDKMGNLYTCFWTAANNVYDNKSFADKQKMMKDLNGKGDQTFTALLHHNNGIYENCLKSHGA